MPRPHVDILDPTEEEARIAGTRVFSMDGPRRHNNLIWRMRWAHNVLHRIYRGVIDGQGNVIPGWRDGDFSVQIRFGNTNFAPTTLVEAKELFTKLEQLVWAAYLYELVDNADAVGTEKDKRKVRQPLEGGGFLQVGNRDWTKKDEADAIVLAQGFSPPVFGAIQLWLANMRKPVAQGQ